MRMRLRARGDERQKDLGRRRVRVLAQPVVLDFPDAVKSELVGQLGLLQTVAEQLRLALRRRVGDLHFVEQRKLHLYLACQRCPAQNQRSSRRAVQRARAGAASDAPEVRHQRHDHEARQRLALDHHLAGEPRGRKIELAARASRARCRRSV